MRNAFVNTTILFSTALGLFATAAPALAQEADNDIVVTARRTEERLQDVPISISVFNQEQIDNLGVSSVSDLATFTPSLSNNGAFGPQSSSFIIRGFTQETSTAPSVGVYFAEALAPRNGGVFAAGEGAGPGSFYDLQNVQVLKGPQGTLFGRNTTGGAILLVPQRPTSEFEGYVEASAGNFGMSGLQAVLNLPISDNARLRLGYDGSSRAGYLHNISGVGADDIGSDQYASYRASLSIDLTPNLENYTIATYVDSQTNGFAGTITDCDFGKVLGTSNSTIARRMPIGAMACAEQDRLRASGDFYAVENNAPEPHSNFTQWQVINNTTWRASDNLTVKNIMSYGEIQTNMSEEPFGTRFIPITDPVVLGQVQAAAGGAAILPAANTTPISFTSNIDVPGLDNNHQYTFANEFQLQGTSFANRLTWQTGVYYEKSGPVDRYSGTAPPSYVSCSVVDGANSVCAAPYGAVGRLAVNIFALEYEDMAAYAQSTFDVTDRLHFTTGIRYTRDHSESDASAIDYRFNINGVLFPQSGPVIGQQCQDVSATRPPADQCWTHYEQTTQAATWLVDLSYDVTDDVMIYGKYARGYRAGLVNPRAPSPLNAFGPEQVDLYEIGAKASWRGAVPGHFNISAFYNDFARQQQLVSFLNGGQSITAPSAASSSEITGVEVDAGISPMRGLRLNATYGYLDTELKGFDPPDGPPGYSLIANQAIGFDLAYAPRQKWSLSAAYTFPLPETVGEVTLNATYTSTDDYFSQQTERARVEGYDLLNLSLNWDSVGGSPVDLSLFGNNVLEEEYYTSRRDLYTSLGFVTATQGQPRMYGARLRYRFGAQAS